MAISPPGSAASSTHAPLGLLCWLFRQRTSPSSPAGMPLYVMTIFVPFRPDSTTARPAVFTRCSCQSHLVSKCLMRSACLLTPVRLSGELCTVRMNVHLVLHLHNISGSMSLG